MIVHDKPPLDGALLEHFGVKGMKWGVHRTKETSEEKAFRKEAQSAFREKAKPVTEVRLEQLFGDSKITKEQYNKLSTKAVVIKKGTTVRRLTRDPNDVGGGSHAYVSTNRKDATTYRAVLPAEKFLGLRRKKYEGNYELTLKTTKQLHAPSEKERVDAFIQLMDTKSIKLKGGRTITGREHLKRMGYAPQLKRVDSMTLGLNFYNDFVHTQGMRELAVNSAYFELLRSKGYNALHDDQDRNIISKDPLIILDPKGNLKNVGIKQLSTHDVLKAQRDFEFAVPKPKEVKNGAKR